MPGVELTRKQVPEMTEWPCLALFATRLAVSHGDSGIGRTFAAGCARLADGCCEPRDDSAVAI